MTETEYHNAIMKLQKEAAKLSSRILKDERNKSDQTLKKIKKNHKESIGSMKKSQAVEKQIFRRKLREHQLQHKKQLSQDLARMKRQYQVRGENIREFYSTHYSADEKKSKEFEGTDLASIVSRYEAIANKIIARLDAIHDLLAHRSPLKAALSEAKPSNASGVIVDSEVISKSDEMMKLEKLREIAEMIKRISAEKKKIEGIHGQKNAV